MRKKHHTSVCESTQSSIDNLSMVNKSSQDTMKLDARAKEQPAEKNMSGMTESSNTIRPTLLATVQHYLRHGGTLEQLLFKFART